MRACSPIQKINTDSPAFLQKSTTLKEALAKADVKVNQQTNVKVCDCFRKEGKKTY